MTDKEKMLKRLKWAIFISLTVFVISFIALAARIVYVSFYANRDATVVVPDNLIEAADGSAEPLGLTPPAVLCEKPSPSPAALLSDRAAEATVIELYLGQSADNDAFRAENMLPGDTVTKYYCLKAYHQTDITVYFRITDIADTKSLADMLTVKVTRLDETDPQILCHGSFSTLKQQIFRSAFSANSERETVAYYRMDVSLPASAGNEYQGASLSASFCWYTESPASAEHRCESECPVCGGCMDATCESEACADKCSCEPLAPKPSRRLIIWPWTVVPALSLASSTLLIIIFRKKIKELDHDE